MKNLSCKFADESVGQLEAEAERRKATISDVIRLAVEAYFVGEGGKRHNMQVLMTKLEKLEFEIAKTRAVLLRVVDRPEEVTAALCEQARIDAEAYLKKET